VSTIDDAIIARAAATAALTAVIGAQPNMRLYPPDAVPQNPATPYVAYHLISGPRVHAMGSDPGLAHPRFQFSCWGGTNTEAKNCALQVMACFSRWRGIFATVEVVDSFLEDEHDLGRDAVTKRHHRALDFFIWHRE